MNMDALAVAIEHEFAALGPRELTALTQTSRVVSALCARLLAANSGTFKPASEAVCQGQVSFAVLARLIRACEPAAVAGLTAIITRVPDVWYGGTDTFEDIRAYATFREIVRYADDYGSYESGRCDRRHSELFEVRGNKFRVREHVELSAGCPACEYAGDLEFLCMPLVEIEL